METWLKEMSFQHYHALHLLQQPHLERSDYCQSLINPNHVSLEQEKKLVTVHENMLVGAQCQS
jgi:hypothetical protein